MRSVAGVSIRDALVFLARRRPGGDIGGKWEFPGGKCEEGEGDETAVLREFREEFGLSVTAGAIIGKSSFANNGKTYELAAIQVLFEGEPPFLHEHVACRWVGAEELVKIDLADSDRSLLPFVLPLLVVS
ncbi:MAG: CTP pyrophosphohydrolase [Spirochaetae bacterium HGW-Spirochaetae-7]|nr:MAG: CTP pyrophosphohydrolase [Spirochaetae bacterium HGW-Spirochaetae-7]